MCTLPDTLMSPSTFRLLDSITTFPFLKTAALELPSLFSPTTSWFPTATFVEYVFPVIFNTFEPTLFTTNLLFAVLRMFEVVTFVDTTLPLTVTRLGAARLITKRFVPTWKSFTGFVVPIPI